MSEIKRIEREIRELADREGYLLNPDREILDGILDGLAANEERLGYWNCPCRRASGSRRADFDIICPCQYRDPDLKEFGRCFCALYVTRDYIDRGLPPDPIPERRTPLKTAGSKEDQLTEGMDIEPGEGTIRTWRCQVCGYLCARPEAPPLCPICRAKKERFEKFALHND